MRTLLVASAMLSLVLGTPGRAETGCAGNDDAGPAKILFRGELAEIAIDPALFQTGPTHRLFIGIRISNTAARPIGVALGKPFDVIYPNQMGISPRDHREVVDEGRLIIADALDDATTKAMLADFADHRLAEIRPQASLVYCREFFGGDRVNQELAQEIDRQSGNFLIIALDGRLALTDGQAVEYHRFGINAADSERVVALPLPPGWRTLAGSETIMRDGDR